MRVHTVLLAGLQLDIILPRQFPKDWITGQARDDTMCSLGVFCFGTGWLFLKDWITGQVTPPNRYALRWGPRQPVMTQYKAWWTCFGGTFPPFHLSTFPRPNRSTYILWRRIALICITLSGLGLPGVNLIIYKDDLRMMAPNPVAAKEGGMQEFEKHTRQIE